MINQSILITVFVVAMPCVPHCVGQSNVVFYGTNASSIGVSFVDTNLSVSAQASIVTDLQICLNEWGNKSELRLRNKENSAGYFYNSTQCPHYPENIEFPENVVTNTNGPILQISKTLSDAYTNAFVFAAANSNVIAAAYEFVAFVSSSNFVSTVTSNTIHNYILVKDTSSDDPKRNVSNEYYQVEFSGIIEGVFQYLKYYPPSVLGFYHTTNGPGTTNFCVKLPAKSNSVSSHDEWDGFPAVWHDNRWKVCIGYEWVP